MTVVLVVSLLGAVAIVMLPKAQRDRRRGLTVRADAPGLAPTLGARMRYFTYRSLGELQAAAEALPAPHVRFVEDKARVQAALGGKVEVGGRTVGNAMAIHPMEGLRRHAQRAPGYAHLAAL